jgi:hypothetical protein
MALWLLWDYFWTAHRAIADYDADDLNNNDRRRCLTLLWIGTEDQRNRCSKLTIIIMGGDHEESIR